MGEEEVSPAGTGPVGSEHDQNLTTTKCNMPSCWNTLVSQKLCHCPHLVDEDDGHTDGGDDQHGHHPHLVLRGQGPAHLLHVRGCVTWSLIKLITDAGAAAGNEPWLVSWFGES